MLTGKLRHTGAWGPWVASCDPELILWRMSLYGAEIGGDLRFPAERCADVYGITVPKKGILDDVARPKTDCLE